MEKHSFFKAYDIIVIIAVLAVSALVYLLLKGEQSGKAVIIYDSLTVKEVSLDEDAVFSINEAPNVVFQVKNGGIAFIQSDCPDKVCLGTGFISRTGQSAVCLPNKIMVRVEGDADHDVDTVTN